MLTMKHSFKLFEIVNKYLKNQDDSRIFVSEIEEIMDNKFDMKIHDFATRKDLAEVHTSLKLEIAELRTEVRTDMSSLRADFHKLDAGINLSLANSAIMLEKTQKEQIKWLVGAMVAIMGLAVTIIKLF